MTDYDRAVELAKEEKFEEAVPLFEKAANEGHAKAQYNLALCYHEGLGGFQSHAEAFKFFKKAALKGHARAHYMLGCYFAMDLAPYPMPEEAFHHFQIAAEAGIEDAHYNLALCYINGQGVEQSYPQGAFHLEEAIRKGHEEAPKLLTKLLQQGKLQLTIA